MTKGDVMALANAVCNEHEQDAEFAREAVEKMLLEIPQIRLSDDDREWFQQVANTYDITDYVTSVFNLGALTGLGMKMELWTEE